MRAVASPEQPADRGPAQPSSEPSPETPSAAVGPAVPADMPAAWPAHTPQTPVQQAAGLAALGGSQPGSLPAPTTNLPPPSAPAALSASTIAPGASNPSFNQCSDNHTSSILHPAADAPTTTALAVNCSSPTAGHATPFLCEPPPRAAAPEPSTSTECSSQSNLQTQLPPDWRHLAASSTLNPGAAPFQPTFPQSPQHRPRGPNFTAGCPLWCTNCVQRFSSRAQLWDHLKHCRPTATRPLATTLKRKRDNPPPALGPAPLPVLTYADAATAPPAKRHQSIHNSASGTTIPTIALPDGTIYYDTRPPSHTPAMEYALNFRRLDTIQQFGCHHLTK